MLNCSIIVLPVIGLPASKCAASLSILKLLLDKVAMADWFSLIFAHSVVNVPISLKFKGYV